MTTGYVAIGGSDLDALFKPRTLTAIANTNFKSNGGVDLAQRFEPRSGAPAIANTGFVAGASDLAQLFMGISAGHITSMVAGNTGTDTGYSDGIAFGTITGGSISNTSLPNGMTVAALLIGVSGPQLALRRTGTHPPNTDASWATLAVTGNFSDDPGTTVTRTATRSTSTYSTATNGANLIGLWGASASFSFINGNSYSLLFTFG